MIGGVPGGSCAMRSAIASVAGRAGDSDSLEEPGRKRGSRGEHARDAGCHLVAGAGGGRLFQARDAAAGSTRGCGGGCGHDRTRPR